MGNHISALFSTAVFAAFCGTASAYTLTGTVKNGEGQIVEGAKVALLNLNQSATTDNEGKFTIHEEEQLHRQEQHHPVGRVQPQQQERPIRDKRQVEEAHGRELHHGKRRRKR